jgi:hypothetical protein
MLQDTDHQKRHQKVVHHQQLKEILVDFHPELLLLHLHPELLHQHLYLTHKMHLLLLQEEVEVRMQDTVPAILLM